MAILTEYEREILKKFSDGKKIESKEEMDVLDDWASVGFVSFEFLSGTARLTEGGKKHLYR
ncbi:MAG: hypothetical protein CVT88_06375 [Candidatus Altiarchaeales archaeon HGW-Altiarchaeales-1]|nr:MAG: hypothetical protein CVT89_07085 [Candidatus Altiarchaeales archaeon HGW-Altiarchaeales-2]PKP59032.1 MAG: hypothetical protein CVT88_06375 [Candidatus Altiarchaeales archaeon HGW-Altiarchaeales-1]